MAERNSVVVKGGGAGSVFWGLFLFFIVLPVVTVLGCFACTGAFVIGTARTGAAIQEAADKEKQSGLKQNQPQALPRTVVAAVVEEPKISHPENPIDGGRAMPPEQIPLTDARPPAVPEPEPPPEPAIPKLRAWTSADGAFHTDAEFAGLSGGVVTLKKADGTKLKVPIGKLSEDDQNFITKRHQ